MTTGQAELLEDRARAFITKIEPDLAGVMTAGALIEELIGVRCGAQSKGLGSRWREVKHLFPADLDDKMGVIIGARNSVAHEAFAEVRSKGRFVSAAREVIQTLLDWKPPKAQRVCLGFSQAAPDRLVQLSAGARMVIAPAALTIAAFVVFILFVGRQTEGAEQEHRAKPERFDRARGEMKHEKGSWAAGSHASLASSAPASVNARVGRTEVAVPERAKSPEEPADAGADGLTLDQLRTIKDRL
ncbi:hypothetical protein [uncultured Ramlibacter sp.]|uniref:hypothetical protein n=1 Tax=uncultured Ramlibacter sp. TaxID=260755 RepID=UPI00262F8DB0|nr:hypothetical protein [uncultured Ramlibacter sp.]